MSFVRNGQTRAPFLLQERDPVSAHTFELEPRVLNGCDLCGLCWPPLAFNPPAVHPSRPAHWPVRPVCRGNGRSTPPGLRSDPQDQGRNTAGVTLQFPHEALEHGEEEREKI